MSLARDQAVWVHLGSGWVPAIVEQLPLDQAGRYFVRVDKGDLKILNTLDFQVLGTSFWGLRKTRAQIHTEDEHAAWSLAR